MISITIRHNRFNRPLRRRALRLALALAAGYVVVSPGCRGPPYIEL